VTDWAEGSLKRFVSVGRFSTEKNQVRLLRAFSRVHRADPATMLVIVGYGPLRDTLEREIATLGLAESAFVVGPYQNPYPIMAAADCFVLSSDYEGQPMVILEAAVLGLPILTVDFASAADALPGSEIRIVPQTVEALAAGMTDFLSGGIRASSIDVTEYNRAAMAEFERAIAGPVLRGIIDDV
jgi:CDP-glycerol glycerophosphotransferase